MFKCDKCDKEFETERQLNGHMSGAHKRGEQESKKRKDRVPVGVKRFKLNANIAEDKVGRWVNDEGGRLQRFQDGGYDFIDDPNATDSNENLGTKISKTVDRGTGKKAYLMQIDKDLYDEDQLVKQGRLDEIDERIKTGKINNTLGDHGYSKDRDGKSMIKYEPK